MTILQFDLFKTTDALHIIMHPADWHMFPMQMRPTYPAEFEAPVWGAGSFSVTPCSISYTLFSEHTCRRPRTVRHGRYLSSRLMYVRQLYFSVAAVEDAEALTDGTTAKWRLSRVVSPSSPWVEWKRYSFDVIFHAPRRFPSPSTLQLMIAYDGRTEVERDRVDSRVTSAANGVTLERIRAGIPLQCCDFFLQHFVH